MHITIAAVGRLRDPQCRALCDDYGKRLTWPFAVREVELKRPLPIEQAKAEEARLLLDAIGDRAIVVALDEHGQDWSSDDLARRIRLWRDDGAPELAFAIGGADGHGQSLLARAAATVAFGRMTWPHRLARVMVIEQIYRAQQIIAGHPYHRA
jgi:23S rRNA (pseudouridine1915-N3)-methyltransferase